MKYGDLRQVSRVGTSPAQGRLPHRSESCHCEAQVPRNTIPLAQCMTRFLQLKAGVARVLACYYYHLQNVCYGNNDPITDRSRLASGGR